MHSTSARGLRPVFAFFILAIAVAPGAMAQTLAMTFAERSVTVNGATPGGDVTLFAVAKEPTESMPPAPMRTTHTVVLHDPDKDGTVVFERERDVPALAIWIAVDVESGRWAASGSPGFHAGTIPLEEFAKHDNAGQLRKLSANVPEMDVLLVRPRAGSWHLFAAKTSEADENAHGNDRALRLDVERLKPLTDSQPRLNSIHKGDVVALIDGRTMRYAVVEVGK